MEASRWDAGKAVSGGGGGGGGGSPRLDTCTTICSSEEGSNRDLSAATGEPAVIRVINTIRQRKAAPLQPLGCNEGLQGITKDTAEKTKPSIARQSCQVIHL